MAAANATTSINSALSTFFDVTSLFPQSEQNTSCPTKYTATTIGSYQLNALMVALQQSILPYATQSGTFSLGFCGIDRFTRNGINLRDITAVDWLHPANWWSSLTLLAQGSYYSRGNINSMGPFTSFLNQLPSSISTVVVEAAMMVGDLVTPVTRQLAKQFWTTYVRNYTRATWNVSMAWDGIMDSGESVTLSSRILGDEFPSVATPTVTPLTTINSYTPLLAITCDLTVSVFPATKGSIAIRLPNIQVALQAAGARLSDMATCRNASLSASDVNTFFNPASVQWWLNLFTVAVGSGQTVFSHPLNITTPADRLYSVLSVLALNAPTTCSYSEYVSTGQCAGQYTGFDSLFSGLDLTLRWTLTSCSSYPTGLPALNLQCVGSDCAAFFAPSQIQACTQDTDCTSPSTCTAVSNTLLPTPFNSWLFNATDNTCDNSNRNALDIVNYVRTYLGLSTQALTVTNSSSLGYCSMRWQQTVISTPSSWVANLTTKFAEHNGTFFLDGLNSYVPPVVTVSSSTGGSSSETGTNPASLPANSAEVAFLVTMPSNPSSDFSTRLLTDVAIDMAAAFNDSVTSSGSVIVMSAFTTSAQVLPYLQFDSLTPSATTPSQSTFTFYVLGTVAALGATETAATLSDKLASDVKAGSFQTFNSQAVVPPGQTVSVTTINSDKNGGMAAQSFNVALLAVCVLAAMWAL